MIGFLLFVLGAGLFAVGTVLVVLGRRYARTREAAAWPEWWKDFGPPASNVRRVPDDEDGAA